MVSVEERLSNSEQGEEIKFHRASILWTLKEQNSSFKVISGSKSPRHSNINFKFSRVRLFCFNSKELRPSFQKNVCKNLEKEEIYFPKSYLQVSKATGFRSSARLSKFKGSLREHNSERAQIKQKSILNPTFQEKELFWILTFKQK